MTKCFNSRVWRFVIRISSFIRGFEFRHSSFDNHPHPEGEKRMTTISRIYRESLALLTDLYQLTMAYGYWKLGNDQHEAVFHLVFRNNPFEGGYTLACGLQYAIDFLAGFRFEENDLTFLATLKGNDGQPLF